MNRQMISRIAHGRHPIAAPLNDAAVHALLDRALGPAAQRVLDLGCGGGAWLVRSLVMRPDLRAEGVDLAPEAIAEARETARAAGVQDRLTLHQAAAGDHVTDRPCDVVLSVGAAHAFGGLDETLAAIRKHLAPGGRVLIGDGFWERAPGPDALKALDATPGEYDDLATTVDRVRAGGWAVVHGHVSTPEEWDDYEWSWTGALEEWAADRPGDPDRDTVLQAAAEHRGMWLRGYRGTLGFVTLVLRDTAAGGVAAGGTAIAAED